MKGFFCISERIFGAIRVWDDEEGGREWTYQGWKERRQVRRDKGHEKRVMLGYEREEGTETLGEESRR